MVKGWLTGWKEISKYAGVCVMTCKRYRKKYSMPVNYLPGGTPVSIPQELDQWLIQFNEIKNRQNKKPVPLSTP